MVKLLQILTIAKMIDSFALAMRHTYLQPWLMAGVYLLHLLFFESLMLQSANANIAGISICSHSHSRKMPVKGLIEYAQLLKYENNEDSYAEQQTEPEAVVALLNCNKDFCAPLTRLFGKSFSRLAPAWRLYRLIQVFRI